MKAIIKAVEGVTIYPNDDAKSFRTKTGIELLRINRQVKPVNDWCFVDTDSIFIYIVETFRNVPAKLTYVIKNTGTVLFENNKKVQSYDDKRLNQIVIPGGFDREKSLRDSEYIDRRWNLVFSRILHELHLKLILIPNCEAASTAANFTVQGFVARHKNYYKKDLTIK